MSNEINANPATPLSAVMQTMEDDAQQADVGTEATETLVTEDFTIPALKTTESDGHQDGLLYTLELFGTGCLECKHLVDDADVDYKSCHFSQGNMACPARAWRISFIGDRVKWEHRVKKVLDMPRGSDRTNRMLMLLEKAKDIESDALRDYVLQTIGL